MNKVSDKWFQLVIRDQNLLSGSSVLRFLEPIVAMLNIRYVLLKDLMGATPGLLGADGTLMTIDTFMKRVGIAAQYDWAFFYLYVFEPGDVADDEDLALIGGADLTVRLVDGAYFYVYGKSGAVLDELQKIHSFSECVLGSLDEFDVPY